VSQIRSKGVLFLGIAALLWATDGLFRSAIVKRMDPLVIVLVEHVVAVGVLFPWLQYRYRKNMFQLSFQEWLSAIFCGVGGSALGTLFFTASFLYLNPSLPVLLLKLQPILISLIAYVALHEKLSRRFFLWTIIALGASIVLSFPDLDFHFLHEASQHRLKGVFYALLTCLLWSCSLIAGKKLLVKLDPALAAFWRFVFGGGALFLLLRLSERAIVWKAFWNVEAFSSLLYLSLFPGLIAILFYYYGLAKVSASVAGFIELFFPVGTIFLNAWILHESLQTIQLVAVGVLLFAIAML